MNPIKNLILPFVAVLFLASAPGAMAKESSVTLSVKGMTCASCPYIVKKSLSSVKGVKTVKVSLEERKAWVVFDDAQANTDQLTAATGAMGFPSAVAQ
ncbi:MAG: mercuric transport protein periplasmic component [Alphaproteobacteria bacterium]|nr:mercuric transport protein periplasmic component [Alphaproteobacteria bacterium]MBT7943782.1 mercuric transport protein periplasmic component [Alphaproteobacteria bacterium]